MSKRLRSVKRTTVHREIADIQAILNWAVSRRYITQNPLARYKKPQRDDAVIMPPTVSETERLIKVAAPHLARALILSYYTGLRPGKQELFSLTWEDIDWQARTIMVTSAKKGGLKRRVIPLHKQFARQLKIWHKQDGHDSGPIVRYHGRAIKSAKKAFQAAKDKAKITRRLRPYDFRHHFASAALGGGGDLKATSEILGHSRPDTTMKVYQHTNTTLHREVVNKIRPLKIRSGTTNVVPKSKAANSRRIRAGKRN